MTAYLVYLARVFPIQEPVITLGRNFKNSLVLANPSVSREHAEIVKQADGYYIRDLDSTMGTLVNQTQIKAAVQLHSGDIIGIAGIELFFYEELEQLTEKSKKRTSSLNDETIRVQKKTD